MQVISKSELLQTLKEIQCQMYRSRIDGVGAVSWFSDIVNEQTVIDAAPIVRAKWVVEFDDRGWKKHSCSNCGYFRRTDIHVSLNWDYCPHCGAKMDLEDKE